MQTDTEKMAENYINKVEIVGKAIEDALDRVGDRANKLGGPKLPYLAEMMIQLIILAEGERIYDDIVKNFQS